MPTHNIPRLARREHAEKQHALQVQACPSLRITVISRTFRGSTVLRIRDGHQSAAAAVRKLDLRGHPLGLLSPDDRRAGEATAREYWIMAGLRKLAR